MKKIFITLAILLALVPATVMHAQSSPDLGYTGLVQCDGVPDTEQREPLRQRACDFAALMDMVNHIITWLFRVSVSIFVFLFAYAGFLMMTPNPGNKSKAKKMLWAAFTGFVIMLCAYFAVTTLVSWVVSEKFKDAANVLVK